MMRQGVVRRQMAHAAVPAAEGSVHPLPSLWTAMRITLVLACVSAPLLGILLATSAGWAAGVSAGLIVGGVLVGGELLAVLWLQRALRRFAAAFVGVPHEAWARWTGDQGLRWPTLGISVSGRVFRYHVPPLVVTLPEESYTVPARRAQQAGVEARRRAAEGPETWTVRITRRQVFRG